MARNEDEKQQELDRILSAFDTASSLDEAREKLGPLPDARAPRKLVHYGFVRFVNKLELPPDADRRSVSVLWRFVVRVRQEIGEQRFAASESSFRKRAPWLFEVSR